MVSNCAEPCGWLTVFVRAAIFVMGDSVYFLAVTFVCVPAAIFSRRKLLAAFQLLYSYVNPLAVIPVTSC